MQAPATGASRGILLVMTAVVFFSIGDLLALRRTFEQILGRPVDLVTYGGLRPGRDDDILREAVVL